MSAAAPDDTPLEISAAETAQALEDGSAVVVDVREDQEREAGHIGGTRHIAVGDLAAQAESLPRERAVIFYCLSGARSAMAAQAFRAAGYDARSMAGGIAVWDAEGRPLSPEGGHVAGH
jgi:hydroxyacylglutathione hydrolase/adenylyltransferase/sulfurtransferase